MRLAPLLVVERVEDRERRRIETDREPEGRGGFLLNHRQAAREQARELVFLTRLGVKTDEQTDFDHGVLLCSLERSYRDLSPIQEKRKASKARSCPVLVLVLGARPENT